MLMFEERKEKEAQQSVTFLQKMDRPRGYGESLLHDQTTCAPVIGIDKSMVPDGD